jgi:hypothetical protein
MERCACGDDNEVRTTRDIRAVHTRGIPVGVEMASVFDTSQRGEGGNTRGRERCVRPAWMKKCDRCTHLPLAPFAPSSASF